MSEKVLQIKILTWDNKIKQNKKKHPASMWCFWAAREFHNSGTVILVGEMRKTTTNNNNDKS